MYRVTAQNRNGQTIVETGKILPFLAAKVAIRLATCKKEKEGEDYLLPDFQEDWKDDVEKTGHCEGMEYDLKRMCLFLFRDTIEIPLRPKIKSEIR